MAKTLKGYFSKKEHFDTLTTNEMFSKQRFAILTVFFLKVHSGASHSHTMYMYLGLKWVKILETAFVCLLIHCEETVQLMQFVPECCLVIKYIQYKMLSFLQENLQSVQCVDVSSVP